MAENRTQKVILNSAVTLSCQIVYLVVSFVCRTIFTKNLGAEYLGISGLFSNILTILSFAELGIGSALVYRMYKPLATNDQEKLREYIQLYKQIYRIITLVILLAGLAFVPFIPSIIIAPNVKENVTLLYILYLAQTLVTYVFVYKKSILIADQKSYIVNICTQMFNLGMNIAQCVFLVVTHNFVIYCILNIVFNLANNIVCSYYADKQYPYLRKASNLKLSSEEIKNLFKDVKGLLLTKIASTAFSGTDNIFISTFIGIRYVGILSNYTVLSSIVNSVLNQIFDAITASIGNLVVTDEKSRAESVLKKLFFLNTSLYGYLCLGMLILLREFVTQIWLDSEYDLPQVVIMLILFELFLRSIHYPLYMTRSAMGCFSEYKVVFAVAAVLNIALDYVLVRPMGIAGLYIATIICRGITYFTDAWVVYHQQLNRSVWNYLYLILKWIVFLAGCGFVMTKIVALITISGFAGFILRGLTISIIYALLHFLTFSHCEEFKYYLNIAGHIVYRIKRKN